jgi:hypothetical protein
LSASTLLVFRCVWIGLVFCSVAIICYGDEFIYLFFALEDTRFFSMLFLTLFFCTLPICLLFLLEFPPPLSFLSGSSHV